MPRLTLVLAILDCPCNLRGRYCILPLLGWVRLRNPGAYL
jgi:hypothetical protein